ncbi:hypothetical protein PS623_02717 [Pseudomonas fluorescens]|uniref:ABC transporter permease n=1 Tax=Pseudomonas fluorescens TaxID=294 RepID=UPI00125779C2|nr:ABC transporter permease [Pseudomonas fluorescens]VVM89793.1 hypothetical protein PS623_02717 [Pseudomonas fluorescens]
MSDLILERVQAPLRRQRRINLPPVGASLALLFLAALLLAALFPELFTHVDPLAIVPRDAFQAPSWAHWLGTDQSGRDIFARIIHGARQSLLIGVAATALSMTIAISLGLLGGLGGARVDRAVGWLLEVLFAFPSLILALLFVAVFGSGVGTLIVATGLGGAPGYARMVGLAGTGARRGVHVMALRLATTRACRMLLRLPRLNARHPVVGPGTRGVCQRTV